LRVALLALLALQASSAVVATRYERWLHAGKLAYNAWDLERALASFDQARRIDESDADLWRLTGDVALDIRNSTGEDEQGDSDAILTRAWEAYGGAVLRCPVESWSWTGVASAALASAELRESLEGVDLAESVALDHRSLDPWRAVALAAAHIALRLAPNGVQELDTLAAVYESMGDLAAAERTYVESARMVPMASFHTWGAGRSLSRPLYEALLGALGEGIDRAPPFERNKMNVEVAQFAMSNSDYETALARALIAERQAAGTWEQARALERLDRLEEALDAVKRARANVPDPVVLSRTQGDLESRCGRFEEACVTLREALRHEPADDGLRVYAADACEKAGESALAEGILRDGLVLPTDSLSVARALIDLYRKDGRERTALYLVQTWAREYPDQQEFQSWSVELTPPAR
jgi:tetratricopeptide (TPR) repeat protein